MLLESFISLDADPVESRYQLEPGDDSALTAEQPRSLIA